ncbi:MAG: flagellar motor switch protein FliN [Planctomycetota bacterium]
MSSAGDATTEDAAPDAEAEAALEAAKQSVSDTSSAAAAAAGSDPQPFEAPDFGGAQPAENKTDINLLGDVDLDVKIELGRTKMVVEDVLKLSDGAVVELDKLAGDPVDVFVNDRHVARGEVLVLNDQFCVRVNEIIDPLADKLSGNAQPAAGDAQPEAG